MKVKIGPYRSWIGPYQISSFIFSWYPKEKDEFGLEKEADFIHDFGTWLSGGEERDSLLMKFCNWVHSKKQRKVKIKIDHWDSWNAHNTASLILHPLLKQLKATKRGAGFIDDEDVPEHLRTTNAIKDEYGTDSLFQERYEWVLNEVIWALEQDNADWEEQYRSGNIDIIWADVPGKPGYREMLRGPNDTYVCDYDGMKVHQDRISNGFRLMGKYWQTFWD